MIALETPVEPLIYVNNGNPIHIIVTKIGLYSLKNKVVALQCLFEVAMPRVEHNNEAKYMNSLSRCLSALIILSFFITGDLHARPIFSIQWLDDDWFTQATLDGFNNYLSEGVIDTVNTGQNSSSSKVPTLKARAYATGPDSNASAELQVSRNFMITREESELVPVALSGVVDLYYDYAENRNWNILHPSRDGEVDAHTIARITDSPISTQLFRLKKDGGSKHEAQAQYQIEEAGELSVEQSYSLEGHLVAIGDSDWLNNTNTNIASATLDLHDPVQITGAYSRYYDVNWLTDWPEALNVNISADDDNIDFAGEIAGYIAQYYSGESLIGDIVDAVIGSLGGGDTVERKSFYQGVGYVYAAGTDGGYAREELNFNRQFQIVPDHSQLVEVGFNGFLNGLLSNGQNTMASLDRASVAILGTELDWSLDNIIPEVGDLQLNQVIKEKAFLKPYTEYTFASTFRLSAFADSNSFETAIADFGSSLSGSLFVKTVPEPSGILLLIIGIIFCFLLTARKTTIYAFN